MVLVRIQCILYIPPIAQRITKLEVLKHVLDIIESKKSSNDIVIILGDFILPFLNWNQGKPLLPNKDLLSEFAEAFLLQQLLQLNDIYNQNGKLLDLILTNKESSFSQVPKAHHYLKSSTSHHHPITIAFNYEAESKSTKKRFLSVNRFDCEMASNRLMESTESTLPFLNGVFLFSMDDMMSITNRISNIVIATTTTKGLQIPKWAGRHPCLKGDVNYFQLLRKYRLQYKKYRSDPFLSSKNVMKAYHMSLLTRFNEKKAITSMMEEDQSLSLNFFKVVKLSKGLTVTPSSLTFEGKLYENDNITALINSFKTNFDNTSTYTINNYNIEVIYKKYSRGDDNKLWSKFVMDINHTEVKDAILSLKEKKNSGPMGIRVELFKRNYVYFTYLLTDLYNMIMIIGLLPET